MSVTFVSITIVVMSALTVALRFLPFAVFKNKTPKSVRYLGTVLPYAIMGMLVVYCLKDVSFLHISKFLPETISILIVVLIYKIRHNSLVSIVSGTLIYMFLVQVVFK